MAMSFKSISRKPFLIYAFVALVFIFYSAGLIEFKSSSSALFYSIGGTAGVASIYNFFLFLFCVSKVIEGDDFKAASAGIFFLCFVTYFFVSVFFLLIALDSTSL